MSAEDRDHSVGAISELMRQRGLEVEIHEQTGPYRIAVFSHSPIGEGTIHFVDASGPQDPWTILPPKPERLDTYRVLYAGDGDWVRLASEAGLDGLISAFRTEYGVLVDMNEPEDLFGGLGAFSSEILVNVRVVDPDKPVLESSHAIQVYLGKLKFPVAYMYPPFGIHSLERVVRQILLYADIPPTEYVCAAPDCGAVIRMLASEEAHSRRRAAMLKSHLCAVCLQQALTHRQGPALPIAPKGWDQ